MKGCENDENTMNINNERSDMKQSAFNLFRTDTYRVIP